MMNYGVVRATVTDNQDPENLGRVRVRYHWYGETDAGKQQTEWASVLRDICHAEGGVWFLPDVGDEVVVSFEHGNRATPIILGSVFNEKHKPPTSGKSGDLNSDGKNTLQFIKTRSGHMLVFDDSEGSASITLRDKSGSEFLMESEQGEVSLIDKNQNKIRLTNDGAKIEDKQGNQIVLDSQGVTIKTAKQVLIGEGATEAVIKGTAFMQYFNTHTHSTPVGPSSPPTPPMNPQMLSQKVKTI